MGDQQFSLLVFTVIWIVESYLARIVKTASGLLESDAVFSHIGSGLFRIPFERNQYSLILLILAILHDLPRPKRRDSNRRDSEKDYGTGDRCSVRNTQLPIF